MGSSALERGGHRVLAYDARGHGTSSPAESPEAYRYEDLGADLEAVLDHAGAQRAVLAGASMGAHTLAWLALQRPERVAGLVLITPAFSGAEDADAGAPGPLGRPLGRPARRAESTASSPPTESRSVPERCARHGDQGDPPAPGAARAPRGAWPTRCARSRARGRSGPLDDLAAIAVPTVVVASGDEADPEHPQAVGEAYAEAIPGARLVTDEPGRSPVAWQGSQLSQADRRGGGGGGPVTRPGRLRLGQLAGGAGAGAIRRARRNSGRRRSRRRACAPSSRRDHRRLSRRPTAARDPPRRRRGRSSRSECPGWSPRRRAAPAGPPGGSPGASRRQSAPAAWPGGSIRRTKSVGAVADLIISEAYSTRNGRHSFVTDATISSLFCNFLLECAGPASSA